MIHMILYMVYFNSITIYRIHLLFLSPYLTMFISVLLHILSVIDDDRVVSHGAKKLPDNKPRYVMGVGYPLDLVVCVALGIDMFDCVFPTRTARFGVALVDIGSLRLKSKEFERDLLPIEPYGSVCGCSTCRDYSKAALHAMLKQGTPLAAQVMTTHNIAYMMRLMRTMRQSIIDGPDKYIGIYLYRSIYIVLGLNNNDYSYIYIYYYII